MAEGPPGLRRLAAPRFDRSSHSTESHLNAKTTISGASLHRQIFLAILVFFAKAFVKSVYTSTGVNKFLFACKERMAL